MRFGRWSQVEERGFQTLHYYGAPTDTSPHVQNLDIYIIIIIKLVYFKIIYYFNFNLYKLNI